MAWKTPKIVEVPVGMEIKHVRLRSPQVSRYAPARLRFPESRRAFAT
jgi:coenzyme PQQ precursor peptide PqqA